MELGDDPDRTGSYQFTFTVYNLSQEPKAYAFGSDVLTEAVETLDGVDYMAETSHGLSPKVDFAVASMPYDLTGDNRVDREDAMAFLRHCNGSLTLPEQKLAILDLDGDGAVTHRGRPTVPVSAGGPGRGCDGGHGLYRGPRRQRHRYGDHGPV